MNGFAIGKYAVEVEKDGIENRHFVKGKFQVSMGEVVTLKPMQTPEELQAELERLRAENESLKRPASRGQLFLKVSEKGALSVYGLGRFPVTLYREQWMKLLGMADAIKQFIEENDSLLKKKE